MFVRPSRLSVATFFLLPLQFPLLHLFLFCLIFGFHLSHQPGDPCQRDHLIPFWLRLEMSRAFGRWTRSHQVRDPWSRFPGEDTNGEFLTCMTLWWWEFSPPKKCCFGCADGKCFFLRLKFKSKESRGIFDNILFSLKFKKKEDRRTFDKIPFLI